jgi:hypothetical protein
LAAVAATGGAFAQAVMTGYIAYGYGSATSSLGVLTSGLGVDDGEINFAISEDIDGVGKLNGTMGVGQGGRGAGATGRDFKLGVTTSSGVSVTFANVLGASYLTNGVAASGTDSEYDLTLTTAPAGAGLFSARTVNDSVTVKIPVSDTVSVSGAHSEGAVVSYWSGTGAAGDAVSGTAGQRYNTLSVDYKAGSLTANAGYRSYDQGVSNSATTYNTRNRGSANYNLGFATVGAGWESSTYMYGNTLTDTLVSANVPLSGAVSVGAQLGSRVAAGNSASSSNYTRNGYLLVANYNLSKQTYIVANYYSIDMGATAANAQLANGYGLYLYKGF